MLKSIPQERSDLECQRTSSRPGGMLALLQCKCFSRPDPFRFVVKVGPDWPEAGRIESALWQISYLTNRAGRQHLKDDDPLDSESGLDNRQTSRCVLSSCRAVWTCLDSLDRRICLEHVHPNPS